MSAFKHFSFDLWLTLIRSNPLFKQQRTLYFHQHFNRGGKPLQEVEAVFRSVDLMCNAINERTGKNIDADEMYLMVIYQLNDGAWSLYDVDTENIYNTMQELLFQHMPVIYSAETVDVLATIKDNEEHTASILSNTGFIKGHTLRYVLAHLGIDKYFDMQYYSDEEGMSKPAPAFFKKMIDEVWTRRSLPPEHIIHIGDNANADIRGAAAAGIHGLHINTDDITIKKLLPYVTPNLLSA